MDLSAHLAHRVGAEAVFTHHLLQRCFRDVHSAGRHIPFSSSRDQAFAKVRLGIDQPAYLISPWRVPRCRPRAV